MAGSAEIKPSLPNVQVGTTEPVGRTANVYRGAIVVPSDPTGRTFLQRNYHEYEVAMNDSLDRERFFIDDMFSRQLNRAKLNGKNSITVLDVGSGDMFWMQEFLDHPEYAQQVRTFLEFNPKFHINVIGVTHAPETKLLGTKRDIVPTDKEKDVPTNKQITVENWYYSITPRQSLGSFLQERGIENEQVDLALSVASMTYLKPHLFDTTIQEIMTALSSGGGKYVASQYAYHTYRDLSSGDIPVGKQPDDSLSQLKKKAQLVLDSGPGPLHSKIDKTLQT